MSHRRFPWYTGAKFFKRVLKNFEKKKIDSLEAVVAWHKGNKERNPELRINVHCSTLGQNFSIFKKLEKFIWHYILGQIFPFFVRKNRKNSKSHPNGPREGVRPRNCWNGPREGVRPKIYWNRPREGVRPNDDRNGSRGRVSPNDVGNGPQGKVSPDICWTWPRGGSRPDSHTHSHTHRHIHTQTHPYP